MLQLSLSYKIQNRFFLVVWSTKTSPSNCSREIQTNQRLGKDPAARRITDLSSDGFWEGKRRTKGKSLCVCVCV